MIMFSIRPIIGAKKGYFRCCEDNRKKDFQFNLTANLPVSSGFFQIMSRRSGNEKNRYFQISYNFITKYDVITNFIYTYTI